MDLLGISQKMPKHVWLVARGYASANTGKINASKIASKIVVPKKAQTLMQMRRRERALAVHQERPMPAWLVVRDCVSVRIGRNNALKTAMKMITPTRRQLLIWTKRIMILNQLRETRHLA